MHLPTVQQLLPEHFLLSLAAVIDYHKETAQLFLFVGISGENGNEQEHG